MIACADDTDASSVLAHALGDSQTTVSVTSARPPPVMTHDPNDQYGPRGGEPVMLHPTQRGYVAKFILG